MDVDTAAYREQTDEQQAIQCEAGMARLLASETGKKLLQRHEIWMERG